MFTTFPCSRMANARTFAELKEACVCGNGLEEEEVEEEVVEETTTCGSRGTPLAADEAVEEVEPRVELEAVERERVEE